MFELDTSSEEIASDANDSTRGGARTLSVAFTIDDTDGADAIDEYPEGRARQDFLRSALKIGIAALKHARGQIDGETVRREGERLLALISARFDAHRQSSESSVSGALRQYFDPETGHFNNRVASLVHKDGDLARVMQNELHAGETRLRAMLEEHLGSASPLLQLLAPNESSQLVCAIRQNVAAALDAEKAIILREFSLDTSESALSRLLNELDGKHGALTEKLDDKIKHVVAEFSLDREDSALSRLVRRVDEAQKRINSEFTLDSEASALSRIRRELLEAVRQQGTAFDDFKQQVIGTLDALKIRKEESARSVTHGHAFQAEAFRYIEGLCQKAGDIASVVGNEAGAIPRSKVGDIVIELGADCAAAGARIAIETKEDASYTLKSTLAEIERARTNRSANIGLFIHSRKTAPANLQPLVRHGNDIVVIWNAEDESADIVLHTALSLAKALCVRAAVKTAEEKVNLAEMERAIGEIEKQIEGFDDIKTRSQTILTATAAIAARADKMRDRIGAGLASFEDQVMRLKVTSDTAQEAT